MAPGVISKLHITLPSSIHENMGKIIVIHTCIRFSGPFREAPNIMYLKKERKKERKKKKTAQMSQIYH